MPAKDVVPSVACARTDKGGHMRVLLAAFVVVATGLLAAMPAAATTGKDQLFHDGSIVGTVVTPAPIAAGAETDPFYNVTTGAAANSVSPVWRRATAPITEAA